MGKHSYLFLIAFIFGIIYVFFMPESPSFIFEITIKVIPMICFILYVVLLPKEFKTTYTKWLLTGLIFCTLGDATLRWFIIGLTFFLIGHICYIFAFLSIKEIAPPKIAMLILLLYGIVMAAWIVGNVLKSGDLILSVSVIFYISVILTMVWAAMQTKKITVLMGAILFLISDSILALNMFVTNIDYSTLFIMSTYYYAQFLFAISVTKHFVIRRKVLE